MKIQQCDDYERFSKIKGNRQIREHHVKTLMSAIMKKDLLDVNPCIVGPDDALYDGQHRIEAAKRLKKPFYYVVSKKMKADDIANLNTAKSNWTLDDYMNYHANRGKKPYVDFRKTKNKLGIKKAGLLISLMSASDGGKGAGSFKKGELEFTSKDTTRCTKIWKLASDFEPFFRNCHNRHFLVALSHFSEQEGYKHEAFVRKARKLAHFFVNARDAQSYLKTFIQIQDA